MKNRILFTFFCSFLSVTLVRAQSGSGKSSVDEAWALWNQNNHEMVEQKFKDAIESDKTNTRAYLGLAYLYELEYKNELAWETFRKIAEFDENKYAYIYAELMTPKIYLNLKNNNNDVVQMFERLSSKADGQGILKAVSNERLGEYYQERGENNKSKKYYKNMNALTEWTVIGPFDNISASGYDKLFPPEYEYKPDTIYSGKNSVPAEWFKITKIRPDYWIDFERYFAFDDAIFYGNTFLFSPIKNTVQIRVGTSGSLKVFLNDSQIIEYFDENNNDLDTYMVEAELQQGWNRLLIKCGYSEINSCNFMVRITNPHGEPIPDLKYTTDTQIYNPVPSRAVKSINNFAEDFFNKKITEFPDQIENYLLLADCYLKNDKAVEAELILRKAIDRSPNCALLYTHILEAYVRGEKRDEVSSTLEKILLLDQQIPDAIEYKFNQYLENKDFENAELYLTKLESLIPETEKYYRNKLLFYSNKEQVEKIIETTQEGYNKFPDSWSFAQTQALILILTNSDYKSAVEVLKSFLKIRETNEALSTLADIYLKSSDVNKWKETIEKMIQLNPAAAGFYYKMANTLLLLQDYTNAETYFNKLMEICPNSSLYWEKLGDTKRAMRETNAAIEAYNTALKYSPVNYDARDNLRELQEKKSIFSLFDANDPKKLIQNAPSAKEYPNDNALIVLNEEKRAVYHKGASELSEEMLIKVFNTEGIDDFKEYYIPYNHYNEELIIEKAVTMKQDGSEIKGDIDDNQIVFKSLEENDYIYLKWKIRNYYSGKLSNQFWDKFYFSRYYPSLQLKYSVLLPKGFEFNYRSQNMSNEPGSIRETEDGPIYTWTLNSEPAVKYESGMPRLEDVGKMLYISSIQDWEYLVKWYMDLAETKTRTSYEINEQLEELLGNKSNLSDLSKIRIVYDFINKNIRYSNQSFRQSGLIPQKARDVLVNRIGDCKDMSTLCIAMLRKLNINAHYLLLNTKDEGLNKNALPAIPFNHCIVQVELPDSALYMDLTAKMYPLGSVTRTTLDAFSLLIKPGEKEPFYLPENKFMKREITRKTNASFDDENGINIKIVTNRTGALTQTMRESYQFKTEEEQIKEITESLSSDYPNVKVTKFSIQNLDTLTSTLNYEYEFKVPNYLNDAGGFKFFKIPWADNENSNKAISYDKRTYPYNWWTGRDLEIENIAIHLPKGYTPVDLEKEIAYSCPAAEYKIMNSFENGIINSTRTMTFKKSEILPEEYLAFKEFLTNVINSDAKQILLQKTK